MTAWRREPTFARPDLAVSAPILLKPASAGRGLQAVGLSDNVDIAYQAAA